MRHEKPRAVLDANTVVSGIFWNGEARKCFTALAKRTFILCACKELFDEYREIALRVKAEKECDGDPEPVLQWLESHAELVEPVPISKLSRDIDDDVYVGCALSARAQFVITRDKDLLVLEKPFGIEILTPRAFLRKIS